MNVPRDCLYCGRPFEGRPNRVYCSDRCKHAEKRRRHRVFKLRGAIEHVERQLKVAEIRRDRENVRLFSWRLKQLRLELEALETGAQREAERVAANCGYSLDARVLS
ncbi:MAG TPA: hypothetical protein VF329_03450 [Gammaproteobacteria bacterium]